MKRLLRNSIIYFVICLMIIFYIPSTMVFAASNPYPSSQTISGVKTIPCTYYAWQQAYNNTGVVMPNFGNAKNWYTSAQSNGYSVGSTPKAKSIAVWTNSGYGHVAYVVSVDGSKMTVNEGGMLNTDGTAYNGNGIINGSVCNSTVGSNKSSYSSSVLVGFIYLTETPSATVSIVSYPDNNSISNTNAVLWGKVEKPSNYAVTKIGIKVRKEGAEYTSAWSRYDTPSSEYKGKTYMHPYYDLNDELDITLTHATKYYYKFYAVVEGKEYWSSELSFTTTGSHSYPSTWTTVTSAKCTTDGSAKRACTSCGNTETKTLAKLGHNYSTTWTIDQDATCNKDGSKSYHCTRCSSKSSITSIPATGNHSYDNACDTECNVCFTIREITHDYEWIIDEQNNCGVDGKKHEECTVCHIKRNEYTFIPATQSHVYDNDVDKECNVCKNVRVITFSGWFEENGKWYYYENGNMVKDDWRKDSTGWVYLGSDGAMYTNSWCTDSNGWCYVGPDGYAVTNCWKQDSIGWIWLNDSGSMTKSSWLYDNGSWYWLDENGYMAHDTWMQDSNGWVYLGSNGAMLTNNWCTDSSGWCYVGADGYAVTNCWMQDSIGWIWLNEIGSMTKSSWLYDNGNWYYLNSDGYMVTGWQYIDGTWYNFNSSGIWVA